MRTWDSYRRNVQIRVKPRIGIIPLQRLIPEDLDAFYAGLLVDGRRNGAGGGRSPRSVRIIHGMLRKAPADACRKGSLVRNVADLADPPKPGAYGSKGCGSGCRPSPPILEEINDHRLAPAFFLAANTGMRRGEVLGLRWDDIDLDATRISVRHAVLNVAYELILVNVKTNEPANHRPRPPNRRRAAGLLGRQPLEEQLARAPTRR